MSLEELVGVDEPWAVPVLAPAEPADAVLDAAVEEFAAVPVEVVGVEVAAVEVAALEVAAVEVVPLEELDFAATA